VRSVRQIVVVFLLLASHGFAAGPDRTVEAKHLKVVLKQLRQSSGAKIILVAEVTLDPGMHVYAPGIDPPYLPIKLTVQPAAGVTLGKPIFPKSERLHLEAIDETVPVYRGTFRIEQPLVITRAAAKSATEIQGSLDYQTCDDKICYRPVSVPLSWTVAAAK